MTAAGQNVTPNGTQSHETHAGSQGVSMSSSNNPGLKKRNFQNPTNDYGAVTNGYGAFSNRFGDRAFTNGFGRGEMTNRFGSRMLTNGFGDRAITNGFNLTNGFRNDMINENTYSNRHRLKEPYLTDPRVMGNSGFTNN
ncbi:MAG: hypothetical protein WDN00_18415 [Limisphaerales bacterium]